MDISTLIAFACAVLLLFNGYRIFKLKKRIELLKDHIDQIRNDAIPDILMEDVMRARENAIKSALSRYH